jgi:argininosuccinate lyase
MKLWQKSSGPAPQVEKFTAGSDPQMDLILAPWDVLGSIAHCRMLASVGLLTKKESADLVRELKAIYSDIQAGRFTIQPGVEDVHSQVELILTNRLGDTGKKIHSARSRNDQVLVDIKMYLRDEIRAVVLNVNALSGVLLALADANKEHLLPGYTHLQLAMPSSFGLWFGAYAESLSDDLITLEAAYRVTNRNPLGSAAGYGSSFPIDRALTTKLLGFEDMNYNSVYAQMTRGKTERIVISALSNVASTMARLASDVCLYMSQELAFVSLPSELTTGSSIMPHKKNPDVFELVRARCNRVIASVASVNQITANLTSGYHRDWQTLKEIVFPASKTLNECLDILIHVLPQMQVRKNILDDPKYDHLFTVEEVNRLVLIGIPFRDAYRQVGKSVEEGTFRVSRKLSHTHAGSIGNLCLDEIRASMNRTLTAFPFGAVEKALASLLAD